MTTTTAPTASKTLIINQSTFRHLIQETITDFSPVEDAPYGFRSDVPLVLQKSAEAFLVEMFKKGKLNSDKWDRDILLPRDLIIGLFEMNFDYITLSQREKPKSLMTLFKKYKK